MPRRFTTSDKWDDEWYRSLIPAYKCAWEFLITKCDMSGVWKPDFSLLSFYIGEKVTTDLLTSLNNNKERINLLKNGYWQIVDFINFQQNGKYNPRNRAHIGILRCIKNHITNGYIIDKRFIDTSLDTSLDTSSISISISNSISKSKNTKSIPKKIKYLDCVYLSDVEYAKLLAQFGEDGVKERIDNLNMGIMSKGYKYKSHYHTILSWERKNEPKREPTRKFAN